jgi:hypothetical protein
MLTSFATFPLSFWVVLALLIGGGFWAWARMRDGSGIPMLAVLFTVCFWYVGDAWYNDYAENHVQLFAAAVLSGAWWQVAWFLIVFLVCAPKIHRSLNGSHLQNGSGVVKMFNHGVGDPMFQHQLNLLFKGSILIWVTLALIATLRLKDQIPYYFFPFLGYKAEPWGRGRIGSGFDALLSVAFYFQLLVAGIFGVVAALATNRGVRNLAFVFCLLAWPYFVFDRTRNTMLAAVIPGVLSYALLRVRGGVWKKALILGGCFVLINAWMAFVIANRSNMTITQALKEKGFSFSNQQKSRHEGLNMFEELCWLNTFMDRGTYTPNWGGRYFAEAVNVIPRSLWPGKPTIGIGYAIARGQGAGDAGQAGVYATISTGMIGQGVDNFSRFLGPLAAALLMSCWVAILGRLDLHIQRLGRIPLYASGLILTFNLGRDITLITLYPFVFGSIAVWWFDRSAHRKLSHALSPPSRRKGHPHLIRRRIGPWPPPQDAGFLPPPPFAGRPAALHLVSLKKATQNRFGGRTP